MILFLNRAGESSIMDAVGERGTERMLLQTGKSVRKEMEEEQYVLIDALPQFVWIIRPDGSLAYTNQRWRDYHRLLSRYTGEQEEFQHPRFDGCLPMQDQQR